MYEALPLLAGSEARDAETAAARLLEYVVARTEANDAWRHTLATVLRWFVEPKGRDPASAARIADAAVSESLRELDRPGRGDRGGDGS